MGHIAVKVRNKTFVFLSGDELYEGKLSMTVKLPISGEMVLSLPFMERAGYGLGKSGWVTMRLSPKNKAGIGMLNDWIDQSYRAVAPKRCIAAIAKKQPVKLRAVRSCHRFIPRSKI